MNKVALIRLHDDQFNRLHANEHLGIGYLASYLRARSITVKIFDSSVDSAGSIRASLCKYNPELIGYTVDVENIRAVIDFDHQLDMAVQPVKCWGGHHASLCASDILRDGCCDIVIMGEGEESLLEVIQAGPRGIGLRQVSGIAYQDGGQTIVTENRSAYTGGDDRPWPARDILACMVDSSPVRAARVLSSQGCPYDCIYCTTPAIQKLTKVGRYRARSPVDFVDEIEHLYQAFGITQFYVNDDLYFCNTDKSKRRALAIAEEILKRGLKIVYKVELRSDSFDPKRDTELLRAMKASGLRTVFVGIESGSDKVLAQLNKKVTTVQNRASLRALRKAGLGVNIGRILFGPDSTWAEVNESVVVLHELGCCHQVFRHPEFKLRVFPGTTLAQRLEEQGRLIHGKKRYFEPVYAFRNKKLGMFCNALTLMYKEVWPLVMDLFAPRSFGTLDSRRNEVFESLCFRFLSANIWYGDNWNEAVFDSTKAGFLDGIKEVAQSRYCKFVV